MGKGLVVNRGGADALAEALLTVNPKGAEL